MPVHETFHCAVCGNDRPRQSAVAGEMVHGPTAELIRSKHPDWDPHSLICLACLNEHRAAYVEQVLADERGELSALDAEVVKSLREHHLLSRQSRAKPTEKSTVGQKLADRLAAFGGSWTFLLIFGGTLIAWILLNSMELLHRPFDPYPFILLNLVLSCVAATQAPVIMMSQNRQEARDRRRADEDYKVNLKAELEIRHIQSKLDQLLSHQWARLIEIQRIQVELLEEISKKRGS